MDIRPSARSLELQQKLSEFMTECVYPAEAVSADQLAAAGDPHHHPQVVEDLKAQARERGLWNLFLPESDLGAGLSNVEYAPLAELMGRSAHLAPEATNCSAPDTGNMEILARFGTTEQKQRWLQPLLDGLIRSAFAMTEPAVASSDATNIELSIVRDGEDYVLNGRKWWASGALHAHCRLLIVMGKTDPTGPKHRQQSMILVPVDTPGVTRVRSLPTFGYMDREGHAEILFEDVRVPATCILSGEGDGFLISQARLGPGRIHHCMRSIGMAERALDLMIDRALTRTTFGETLASRANIQDWIAEARVELEMIRLLTMKAAYLMDTVGNKGARVEIAAIKVAAPTAAATIIDRAIQVFGAAGMSNDVPLAEMYVHQRHLRIADGPDEVHKRTIARAELKRRQSLLA